jgi:uncharacterized OsmC-like protein
MTSTTKATTSTKDGQFINGLDVNAIQEAVENIRANPAAGASNFEVTTTWNGGARSTSRTAITIGGESIDRDFAIEVDEPFELFGTNRSANPQEYLLAAVNACMIATFVAACAMQGVTLRSLELATSGDIDLRGFLAIDGNVAPGYESLKYTFRVDGDGTTKQFEDIARWVQATSPNYFNMAKAIQMDASIEIV